MQMAGKATTEKKICLALKIKGVVQGVGFRPYVYKLAQECALYGWVRNEGDGVVLEIEGEPDQINLFCRRLVQNPPPLAKIDSVLQTPQPVRNYSQFNIDLSRSRQEKGVLVPPDIATCNGCLAEVRSPGHRYYMYPFTNCTNCGPRFTIIEDIPYDRSSTSMKAFPPCPACLAEYNDPADRRFHAQPIACPSCGPRVQITDSSGAVKAGEKSWLSFFYDKMRRGHIFAVKGLGGYHLACIASEKVVEMIRAKKNRPYKPFAVMCRDLETAARYCRVNDQEAALLASPSSPIVLLEVKPGAPLPKNINPHLSTLGVMLPYTPLHHMLLQGPFDVMILTSANPTDLPIIKDNGEALDRLNDVADYYLVHNRPIVQRCDDSVARVLEGETQLYRRSRGFAPQPIDLPFQAQLTVLGAGAEMKSTFCLIKGNKAYLSQHLGEMGTLEAERFYFESLTSFKHLFDLKVEVIGYDLHPDYHVSSIAKSLPAVKRYGVSHHHAHFASCLGDNGYRGKAIGAVLDGTGYGLDGAVWGFEIISGDALSFTRHFHQKYTPMPGGEAAVRWPWRMALSYLYQCSGEAGLSAGRSLLETHFRHEVDIVCRQLAAGINVVPTSSCGRLFDAAAAAVGVCYQNTYEGQAAIELGEMIDLNDVSKPLDPYPFTIHGKEIDFSPVFPAMLEEAAQGKELALVARRFHDTMIKAITEAIKAASERTGLNTVALSGGTWLNPYLTLKVKRILGEQKMKVLLHRQVPTNDGGVSLGQALIAYKRWKEDVPGSFDEDQ